MSGGVFCRLAEPVVGIGARSSRLGYYWRDPRWAWFPLCSLLSFCRSVNLFCKCKFVGCGGLKQLAVETRRDGLAEPWALWRLVGGKKSVEMSNIYAFT